MDSTLILDELLRIFQSLLTPVIAFIAVYIAYQQHKTNREKLRLDLYNKRYEIFQSLKSLLKDISNNKLEGRRVDEFSRATEEAVFLFDEGISAYLKTIRTKAFELCNAKEELKDLAVGEERSAKAREITKCRPWFREQFEVSINKFDDYLRFTQKLKVKAMNWKRGFRRITFVLAIIVAVIGAYVAGLGGASVGFCGVWIVVLSIYKLMRWIILGFTEDYSKDEQKQ